MKVKELKSIIDDYDDEAEVQINVCDGYDTVAAESFHFDDEYDKKESCVIHVNTDKE